MAHFAQLDENNVVTYVMVIDNVNLLDENGDESETVGRAYIASLGHEGTWVQTSYNGKFRGTYAGIGMKYDANLDQFVDDQVTE